jgi:hypothetical protein
MPRRVATDEDWDEEPEDDADWEPDEVEEYVPDDEDEDTTIPCPHCAEPIYDQTERCPHCEKYISEEEDVPRPRKPWWIVLGAILCLYAVIRWII